MAITRMTRNCCISLGLTILALAASLGAQTGDWKRYTYDADGFSATYPALPAIQSKDVPTEAGRHTLRSYNVQLATAELLIAVCDYESAAAGKDAAAMLQGAKNAALLNSSSHLTGEKKIDLDGHPGLEYRAQSDSAQFTARLYLRRNTIYQLIVVAPLGKPFADSARFLDSFQFIARSAN